MICPICQMDDAHINEDDVLFCNNPVHPADFFIDLRKMIYHEDTSLVTIDFLRELRKEGHEELKESFKFIYEHEKYIAKDTIYKENKESYQNEYKFKNQIRGLCISCTEKAVGNGLYCQHHLVKMKKYSSKKREEFRQRLKIFGANNKMNTTTQ